MKFPRLIDGFTSMTKQQIFDMAAKHVLKNGKPGMYQGACSYSGIGCAASPFIVEEDRHFVGNWLSVVANNGIAYEESFVHEIQRCHDRNSGADAFIQKFSDDMHTLASQYNLSTEVFDKH